MYGAYRRDDLGMSRVDDDHHARSAGVTDAKQKSVLGKSESGSGRAHANIVSLS